MPAAAWIGPLLLLLALPLVAGCAQEQQELESGVEGTIRMGPMCPVVQAGSPCPDQPLQARLVVQSVKGKEIAEGTSDAQGKFRIALKAGEYVLVPEAGSAAGLLSAAPQPFEVEAGLWTTVDVFYDTGLR
jgi:hypothetical protein